MFDGAHGFSRLEAEQPAYAGGHAERRPVAVDVKARRDTQPSPGARADLVACTNASIISVERRVARECQRQQSGERRDARPAVRKGMAFAGLMPRRADRQHLHGGSKPEAAAARETERSRLQRSRLPLECAQLRCGSPGDRAAQRVERTTSRAWAATSGGVGRPSLSAIVAEQCLDVGVPSLPGGISARQHQLPLAPVRSTASTQTFFSPAKRASAVSTGIVMR